VELLGGQETLLNYIHQAHLYPLVASEAEIPGEVIVQFIVDAQGIPRDFQIQREDPDGFDFGENAVKALQGMQYRPAYRDGQYIESPTTQVVRFEP
jgi:TonB family protein